MQLINDFENLHKIILKDWTDSDIILEHFNINLLIPSAEQNQITRYMKPCIPTAGTV